MYEKWKEENVEAQTKMKSKVIKHKGKAIAMLTFKSACFLFVFTFFPYTLENYSKVPELNPKKNKQTNLYFNKFDDWGFKIH